MSEEIKIYTCEGCGSVMQFDINSQKLKCTSCGNEISLENNTKVKEYDFFSDIDKFDKEWENQVDVIKCSVCGAESTIDKKTTATFCSFCGSSHVIELDTGAGIPPEAVIPFKIDKHRANQLFIKWIKGRFFAPNSLQKLYQADKFKGIYIPYWTFDAYADSTYTAQGGKHYFVNVKDSKGNTTTRQETRWYFVSGSVVNNFDDVLVNASASVNSYLVSCVEPFDTKEQKPFSTAYMSGFLAEHYSILPKSAYELGKQKMQNELEEMARAQVLRKYDVVSGMNLTARYSHVTYKHLLVPVWLAGYHYKGKTYSIAINAQTGNVSGDSPVSIVKVTILIIILIIVSTLIFWFLYGSEEATEVAYSIVWNWELYSLL